MDADISATGGTVSDFVRDDVDKNEQWKERVLTDEPANDEPAEAEAPEMSDSDDDAMPYSPFKRESDDEKYDAPSFLRRKFSRRKKHNKED